MQIKRVLLIPFILLATVALLPIIAIFFLLMMLEEVISSTIEWVTNEE